MLIYVVATQLFCNNANTLMLVSRCSAKGEKTISCVRFRLFHRDACIPENFQLRMKYGR